MTDIPEPRLLKFSMLKRAPKPRIKWFYATDIPISKPAWIDYKREKEALKFVPFSAYDNGRLENKYHAIKNTTLQYAQNSINSPPIKETQPDKATDHADDDSKHEKHADPCVDVLEDRLFTVDLDKLQLSPVYWEGPIFEVRRGLWFKDSMPVSTTVTQELESAYQLIKPYLFEQSDLKVSKGLLDKFNDPQESDTDELDMSDVVKLSDGTAAMFFNAHDGAIFPQNMLNGFQLPIIRQIGNSGVLLLNVTSIRRGYNGFSELEADRAADASADTDDSAGIGAEVRQKIQNMMERDFAPSSSQSSTREIKHLVLCVHGIGQILGTRYESVNFAHSVNMLRNTFTSVYKTSKRFDSEDPNHKIQVLPVTWRHMVDFNPVKHLTEDNPKSPRLPTLLQINVDGVKSLRNIIGDVAMDILLYYEPKYFEQIIQCVTEELNRIYDLYVKKNPNFSGKVHILGHLLGSAISFDITARQLDKRPSSPDPLVDLNFDVSSLFLIGCPVGMFKLISGKNVVARSEVSLDFDPRNDPLVVSPKCDDVYNLYHPCDPVAYRLEPLIQPQFSEYQAEEVPFATDGINTQIKGLSMFTDDIQDKFIRAASWFSSNKAGSGLKENALGDIVTSIVRSDDPEPLSVKNTKLTAADTRMLTKFNKRGRVDFSLPMGVFDISLVSAISAHITYFEDEDTAGFVVGELLEQRTTK